MFLTCRQNQSLGTCFCIVTLTCDNCKRLTVVVMEREGRILLLLNDQSRGGIE